MEEIFILGNSQTMKKLGDNFIEIPNLINDVEIHKWIVQLLQPNDIDIEKLVIEIGDKPTFSLRIAYHIRLSIDELHEKTLVPILFVSTLSLNSIMLKTGIFSQILATKGTYFSELEDIAVLKSEIEMIEGLSENDYLTGFLKIIHILPDETFGRHSLANIWGAFAMDKAANTNALPKDAEFKKTLYFKYVSAFNNTEKLKPSRLKIVGQIAVGKPNYIEAKGKRILLIDDEADNGWDTVLREVFKTSSPDDFVVINEKVKDFDALFEPNKKIITDNHFDLYLVDLRLNGLEEEDILKTEDFSGMKVLRKIKSLNQGNQVIIFTASNKVWNLKALLDAGADGYYMKESPEYNFTKAFSEQNYKQFQEDVRKCFERNFLTRIYSKMQTIKDRLSSLSSYPSEFLEEIVNQLNLFWNMISKAQTETDFSYSFVALYMIIEIINNQFIIMKDDKWEIISEIGNLHDWEWDKTPSKYVKGTVVEGKKIPESKKITGLYFQKWKKTDNQFIHELSFLITKRNGVVHNDKRILDKKNSKGKYLNHDVKTSEGVLKLFMAIEKIIDFL
ncbi:MAG: hypothetical protein LBQ68_04110 [Clostridiales bacterium]|jgi:DNA-binding NarL/FixJ family response regulator|nr:hypothetical protein [Clostridiales bacterium]